MTFGLLGEKLGHSYSKMIHEELANYTYDLLPTPRVQFDYFMKKRDFKAINVTIPYKEAVLPYLDEIDEQASKIHAVNTIVNKNGKLYGHNTDFDGFLYLLNKNNIEIQDKKVLVLGYGGASKAILAVLKHLHAKDIVIVNRTAYPETISLEEALEKHTDVEVLINTTSVGMAYGTQSKLLSLDAFTKCTAVVDIIYNPLYTPLLLDALAHGMKAINGLEMLAAQAKYAVEYFTNTSLSDECIDKVVEKVKASMRNIVLIGMPSAGKSTIGKALSEHLSIPFVDLDDVICDRIKMSIPQFFNIYGEERFRDLETEVCFKHGALHHQVIATGGGAVLRSENIEALKANGILIWVRRPLELLLADETRPLSKNPEAIQKIYDQRVTIYEQTADYIIDNDGDLKHSIQACVNWLTNYE